MAYANPYVFDPQASAVLGGFTGQFLTPGSSWTRVQNSGFWGASVWVRKHTVTNSGETRDRCLATNNQWQPDAGDDSGPGDTLWFYEEFVFPTGFPFAGGSWNNISVNLHHTSGVNGSTGQVPFHLIASDARGPRELFAQVRGGTQNSTVTGASDQPNNEDFFLGAFQFNHVYRIMVRITLAPNGTVPSRNQIFNANQAGSYIVPFTTGDSYGRFEVWVDDVLKVSKRRPTSYRDLTVYLRSGYDRNGSDSPASATHWHTKLAVGTTRAQLFSTVVPATTDTFEAGGDSDSGGGGGGTSGPASLGAIPGGKVRYGIVTTGEPPGSRTTAGADRVRASGPITVDAETSIEKLYWHIESVVTGTQVYKLVVWDDDGTSGEPLTRKILSQEVSKTGPFSPIWEATTLGAPVVLPAGNYWVGIHSGGTANVITHAYEAVVGSYRSATDTYSDGSPTSFPANTSDSYRMAVVLEGTVTGGGGGGSTDTTKPTIISAEALLSNQIALQADEELSSATPAAAAFNVTLDGVNQAPTSVAVGIDIVVLTMANVIVEGVPILVDYDKTLAVNPIEDVAGNEMDSFTDQVVVNSNLAPGYSRAVATRIVDPSKRIVGGAGRIIGRTREVWT